MCRKDLLCRINGKKKKVGDVDKFNVWERRGFGEKKGKKTQKHCLPAVVSASQWCIAMKTRSDSLGLQLYLVNVTVGSNTCFALKKQNKKNNLRSRPHAHRSVIYLHTNLNSFTRAAQTCHLKNTRSSRHLRVNLNPTSYHATSWRKEKHQ